MNRQTIRRSRFTIHYSLFTFHLRNSRGSDYDNQKNRFAQPRPSPETPCHALKMVLPLSDFLAILVHIF